MNTAGKAIVVGGSLGGLFVANLLLREGWDVHVYEREGLDMAGRGAGIVTHPELMHALTQAGAVVDDSLGVNIVERIALGQDGTRVGSRTVPQLFTSWGRMFQALRSVFADDRYHHGMPVTGFAQDASSVSVTFADGSTASADLLVATDGVRSTVRQVLLPDAALVYAGYVAWRGVVEESALSAQAMKDVFPYFAFGLPPHEQLVAYPIAGHDHRVDAGHRRYNFVWYRPVDGATTLQDLMTDASGKLWSDGIPPPLIRPEILSAIRQVAREVLAPQFAELIEKTESLFFQPIYDMASTQLAFGRVALLGDAAFVARPHCGMGVTKAAGDALELVRALGEHDSIEAALKAYEGPRLGLGQRTIAQARHLGAYLQAQISTPMEREMAERYRAPDVVLAETAMPLA
jgi:2-polyprenyl-6-methoxyphenol hydroxylase-like FAD-dependent oxidoreductase